MHANFGKCNEVTDDYKYLSTICNDLAGVSPGWLVVEAFVWLVAEGGLADSDKSVLWQFSGKEMPHADQKAVGKVEPLMVAFTQHPNAVLKLLRAAWQEWTHPCVESR